MSLVENATMKKLRAGGIALGFGVHHLRTAAAGMIAAAAGHDWLFIDMEHGAFSQDDVAQICIAALPTGVTPIVRICAGALDEGTRALDNGAAGVIVPHVDTVDQARRIAEAEQSEHRDEVDESRQRLHRVENRIDQSFSPPAFRAPNSNRQAEHDADGN